MAGQGNKKNIDGWWLVGRYIKNGWMDIKMFEKIDGLLDGQAKKKMMVGGIEKQMVGWIAKIDRWLDEQEKIEIWLHGYKNGWMDG